MEDNQLTPAHSGWVRDKIVVLTKKHLFQKSAYVLDLEVPDDEVSVHSRVLEGD